MKAFKKIARLTDYASSPSTTLVVDGEAFDDAQEVGLPSLSHLHGQGRPPVPDLRPLPACRRSCTKTRTRRAAWALPIRSCWRSSEGRPLRCLCLTLTPACAPAPARPACPEASRERRSCCHPPRRAAAEAVCRAVVEVVKQLGSNLLTGNFDLLKISLPIKL